MAKFLKTCFLAAIIVGGLWALVNRDQLKQPAEMLSQVRDKISSMSASVRSNIFSWREGKDAESLSDPVIRIATFKLDRFGSKSGEIKRLPILADICRRYDLIALQGLDGRDDRWLETLADAIHSLRPGSDYVFITDADSSVRSPTQNVILFNRQTLELDLLHWYRVDDPVGAFSRRPLVGWFRTRLEPAERAFTFTVANVELNAAATKMQLETEGLANGFKPNTPATPLGVESLIELFRAIRKDGRGEDDVILMGDFSGCDQTLSIAQQRSGLVWVLSHRPTDLHQTQQLDNILFQHQATVEFTGRSGVLDFMRTYNLRLAEAELLSSRLPVWAEFSAYEGGVESFTPARTARSD
jgi:deoxyribonuclease-1-like protein